MVPIGGTVTATALVRGREPGLSSGPAAAINGASIQSLAFSDLGAGVYKWVYVVRQGDAAALHGVTGALGLRGQEASLWGTCVYVGVWADSLFDCVCSPAACLSFTLSVYLSLAHSVSLSLCLSVTLDAFLCRRELLKLSIFLSLTLSLRLSAVVSR